MDKNIYEAFAKLDTPCVSDALDRLGIVGGLLGIKPVALGTGKVICGPAFTVKYIPVGLEKKTVGDFLDNVPAGYVVVIDNAGRLNCTVWGDIMSTYAEMKGVAGTLIDGVCRDVKVVHELDYPIYTKGCYMCTGKDRVQIESVNQPVTVSDVQVCQEDVIMCDDNGALCIPAARAEEVLKVAQEIEAKEQMILRALAEGSTLGEARKKTGYHHLQTKA